MTKQEKPLYTLIPLKEFKSLLGIDDRDDKLATFCLVTATHTIEEYCKRRLLKKQHFEIVEFSGNLLLPLREYPVRKILAAFLINNEQVTDNKGKILETEFYRATPDCGTDIDIPYSIEFSFAIKKLRCKAIKIVYQAGYVVNPHPCGFTTSEFAQTEGLTQTPAKALKTAASMPLVPPDLASACLELASWNMNRYRGRRIGMTGNVRSGGKDGEHFELSMPENVKQLLEPYKRKVI